MKRRSTIIKQLRENIDVWEEGARIDQQRNESISEAYRRGVVAGYARSLSYLLEPGSSECREAERMADQQRNRLMTMTGHESP